MAVQVINLVSYEGGDAKAFGFSEEEGGYVSTEDENEGDNDKENTNEDTEEDESAESTVDGDY